MREGAKQIINNCLRLCGKDKLVIVTDTQTMDIGATIMDEAKIKTKHISFHILEDFGQRPLLEFPREITDSLNQATVSIIAAQSKPGEIETIRKPLIELVEKKKLRHAHMVGVTPIIMAQGMAADYQAIQQFSKQVYSILKDAKHINVTTPLGSDFTVELNQKIPWIVSDGDIKPGDWSNLPDGEIWTVPEKVEGKIVVDGVLGDHFSQKYGLLAENPVSMHIMDSRVTYIRCENEELKAELEEYMKKDENADRVGEFALGTNLALKELIGNLLQDEKFPGVHFAIGHPYPSRTGVSWDSGVHCDGVLKNPTVNVDSKKLMEDGRYLI